VGMKENRNQGRWGELIGHDQLVIQGYEIKKTGKGSDARIVKMDINGDIVEEKLIDYKTGDAELSEYQEECGAEEYRVELPPFLRRFTPPF